MGLDVYCGPLTRYYYKNWKTVVQQWAEEEHGADSFQIIRPDGAEQEIEISLEETQEIVVQWIKQLALNIKDHVPSAKSWSDDNELSYLTDKPDWDCFGALILWALYHEQNKPFQPLFDEEWQDSKVYNESLEDEYKTKYKSIVRQIEFWIPFDFEFTFDYSAPNQDEIEIASSYGLLENLNRLNKNTWNANAEEVDNWRKTIDPNTPLLEEKAKFAFTIMYAIACFSVENKLPIKLDY